MDIPARTLQIGNSLGKHTIASGWFNGAIQAKGATAMSKISIRIFNDKEVRAVWDEDASKWWFNVVDVCAVLAESENPGVYWRVLKSRLAKAGNQTVTKCNAFKFLAPDGKRRLMDTLASEGIAQLARTRGTTRGGVLSHALQE